MEELPEHHELSDSAASPSVVDEAQEESSSLPWLDRLPAAIPILVALAVVRDLFSMSRVFYLRDLSAQFWHLHLWFSHAARSGESVLWDPYYCFGSPAIADPVRQILFPPAVLLRLLLPDALGFNLLVGLPAPVGAAGVYVLLRRRFRPWAAAAGATVFALSGAVVATENMPNLSWSVALAPWTLAATALVVERLSRRRFALLAAAFALQYLAGEPVTLAATAAIALASAWVLSDAESAAGRARGALAVAGAGLCAILLVLPQALMLVAATAASPRARELGSVNLGDVLRPLDFVGFVSPTLLGDYVNPTVNSATLGAVIRGSRVPYMISTYVGVAALALAVLGAASRPNRRWSLFWLAVIAVVLFLALGDSTPLYIPLHDHVPIFGSFRSPSKLIAIGMLAIAGLVASGWSAVADGDASPSPTSIRTVAVLLAVVGVAAAVAGAWAASDRAGLLDLCARIGADLRAPNVETAAAVLADAVPAAAWRLAATGLAGAGLLWASRSRSDGGRRLAAPGLFALLALDLFTASAGLNPSIDAALLAEPEWVAATRSSPESRVYTAGVADVPAFPDAFDEIPHGVFSSPLPEGTIFAIANNTVAKQPSGWRVRQAICYDFTMLAPREYWETLTLFSRAEAGGRARFLSRVGNRYYLAWHPPPVPARVLYQPYPDAPALYDTGDATPRATVVPSSTVVSDSAEQVRALFDPFFDPTRAVLIDRPASRQFGEPGAPEPASARLVVDESASIAVEAHVPEGGGFLLLADTYAPYWRAEVDGREAEIVRADGLFRAVPLASGAHAVRFRYAPTPFYVGCWASLAVALALAALALWRGRGPRRS